MRSYDPASGTYLGYGEMRVLQNNKEHIFTALGGFAEMGPDGLTVLADSAERPDEIDAARAQADLERAMRIIEEKSDDIEVKKAELLLRKSHVRLDVSTFPIIRDRGGAV